MIRLYKPENEIEALAIAALLEENSIRISMESFHDTAYDGVFQGQHGWGIIKVNEVDYEAAIEILTKWQDGTPDATEMLEYPEVKSSESSISYLPPNSHGYKHLRLPMFLSLSILVNIMLGVLHFSSGNGKKIDFENYDINNILMGRFEWQDNKYFPYKYTGYRLNGDIDTILFDLNDDGRTDKMIFNWPNSKETYLDKDLNGVFEDSTVVFDSGSRIEYRDRDQNGVYESSIITTQNGKVYNCTYSNLNNFIITVTTPEGGIVSFDAYKQIALEL